MIGIMLVLLAFFTHGMVLVLWRVGTILGNGNGIQEQNYVAMFQRSEMQVEFHYRDLIFGI